MTSLSRRDLLRGAGALLLAGCAGGSRASLTCPTPELDEYGTQTRETVHYVDTASAGAGQCVDCKFWLGVKPNACGGCHLVRGPIHPQGSCNIFRAKEEPRAAS